jgi:hypothetical protein
MRFEKVVLQKWSKWDCIKLQYVSVITSEWNSPPRKPLPPYATAREVAELTAWIWNPIHIFRFEVAHNLRHSLYIYNHLYSYNHAYSSSRMNDMLAPATHRNVIPEVTSCRRLTNNLWRYWKPPQPISSLHLRKEHSDYSLGLYDRTPLACAGLRARLVKYPQLRHCLDFMTRTMPIVYDGDSLGLYD